MPLSRITQKQILARVTLNGTDPSSTDAGDFIVQNTSADENDNILLEEHTDFGTDILSATGLINPRENLFRVNEDTLRVNHTISSEENAMAAGPLTVNSGVTLTVEGEFKNLMSDLKVNTISGVGGGGFTGTVASDGGLVTTDLQQGLGKV